MAVFKAFRAYRPAKENQALIPALPYDVMNTEKQEKWLREIRFHFFMLTRLR